jgi:hypothetical protein
LPPRIVSPHATSERSAETPTKIPVAGKIEIIRVREELKVKNVDFVQQAGLWKATRGQSPSPATGPACPYLIEAFGLLV